MPNNTAAIAYENNMAVSHQSNVTNCCKIIGGFYSSQGAWVSVEHILGSS